MKNILDKLHPDPKRFATTDRAISNHQVTKTSPCKSVERYPITYTREPHCTAVIGCGDGRGLGGVGVVNWTLRWKWQQQYVAWVRGGD